MFNIAPPDLVRWTFHAERTYRAARGSIHAHKRVPIGKGSGQKRTPMSLTSTNVPAGRYARDRERVRTE